MPSPEFLRRREAQAEIRAQAPAAGEDAVVLLDVENAVGVHPGLIPDLDRAIGRGIDHPGSTRPASILAIAAPPDCGCRRRSGLPAPDARAAVRKSAIWSASVRKAWKAWPVMMMRSNCRPRRISRAIADNPCDGFVRRVAPRDIEHRRSRVDADPPLPPIAATMPRVTRAGAAAEIEQGLGAAALREIAVEIGAGVPAVLFIVEVGEFRLVVVVGSSGHFLHGVYFQTPSSRDLVPGSTPFFKLQGVDPGA